MQGLRLVAGSQCTGDIALPLQLGRQADQGPNGGVIFLHRKRWDLFLVWWLGRLRLGGDDDLLRENR